MSNYFNKPPSDGTDDNDDFWGRPKPRYWKWSYVGQVLEAVVKERTHVTFPNDKEPKKVLIVEAEDGEWNLTVSQVDLIIKMEHAQPKVGTKFRITYRADERVEKGFKKVFDLEILSSGTAEAA